MDELKPTNNQPTDPTVKPPVEENKKTEPNVMFVVPSRYVNKLAIETGLVSMILLLLTAAGILLFTFRETTVIGTDNTPEHASAPQSQQSDITECPDNQYFVKGDASFSSGCKDIPVDNLQAGNGECNLINQIQTSPESFALSPNTKLTLKDWYRTCTNGVTQATCDNNFKLSNDGKTCTYDCVSAQTSLDSLLGQRSSQSTPEIVDQINSLQKEMASQSCPVPTTQQTVETSCPAIQDDINVALNAAKYDEYTKKYGMYLDNGCVGITLNQCQLILNKANELNVTASVLADTDPLYQQSINQVNSFKENYYLDPTCNDQATRCQQLSAKFAGSIPKIPRKSKKSPLDPQSVKFGVVSDKFTPSGVFQDDASYYLNNCQISSATQQSN